MPLLPRRPMTGIQLWVFICVLLSGWLLVEVPAIVFGGGQAAAKKSAQSTRSAPPQGVPRPSLDALKSRAIAYWNLLARGQKSQALQYVEPSRRAYFKAWQAPQFSEPRITTLTLSSKAEEVSVTVEVKRVFPPLTAFFPWPVTENWAFRNGNWFVLVEKTPATVPFPTAPGHPEALLLSPEETRKRQEAIREALQFETTNLEFGTARRGDSVSLSLGYRLAGDEAFGIVMRNSPDDFYIRNLPDRKLPPGKEQKIQIQLLTQTYAGEVDEKLTAIISHQNVEVPYDFKIHGYVYAPVYSSPRKLRFLSGEHEKEIVIRNDSKSEVTINGASNENFRVAPLPRTLPPGGACTLTVSVVRDRPEKNHVDSLSLSLSKPVEDVDSLDLPIVLNYEEVDPQKAKERELIELLRKAGIPIKK